MNNLIHIIKINLLILYSYDKVYYNYGRMYYNLNVIYLYIKYIYNNDNYNFYREICII